MSACSLSDMSLGSTAKSSLFFGRSDILYGAFGSR